MWDGCDQKGSVPPSISSSFYGDTTVSSRPFEVSVKHSFTHTRTSRLVDANRSDPGCDRDVDSSRREGVQLLSESGLLDGVSHLSLPVSGPKSLDLTF